MWVLTIVIEGIDLLGSLTNPLSSICVTLKVLKEEIYVALKFQFLKINHSTPFLVFFFQMLFVDFTSKLLILQITSSAEI